jgi:hypothetical protein
MHDASISGVGLVSADPCEHIQRFCQKAELDALPTLGLVGQDYRL